jgi:hypothetical protein
MSSSSAEEEASAAACAVLRDTPVTLEHAATLAAAARAAATATPPASAAEVARLLSRQLAPAPCQAPEWQALHAAALSALTGLFRDLHAARRRQEAWAAAAELVACGGFAHATALLDAAICCTESLTLITHAVAACAGVKLTPLRAAACDAATLTRIVCLLGASPTGAPAVTSAKAAHCLQVLVTAYPPLTRQLCDHTQPDAVLHGAALPLLLALAAHPGGRLCRVLLAPPELDADGAEARSAACRALAALVRDDTVLGALGACAGTLNIIVKALAAVPQDVRGLPAGHEAVVGNLLLALLRVSAVRADAARTPSLIVELLTLSRVPPPPPRGAASCAAAQRVLTAMMTGDDARLAAVARGAMRAHGDAPDEGDAAADEASYARACAKEERDRRAALAAFGDLDAEADTRAAAVAHYDGRLLRAANACWARAAAAAGGIAAPRRALEERCASALARAHLVRQRAALLRCRKGAERDHSTWMTLHVPSHGFSVLSITSMDADGDNDPPVYSHTTGMHLCRRLPELVAHSRHMAARDITRAVVDAAGCALLGPRAQALQQQLAQGGVLHIAEADACCVTSVYESNGGQNAATVLRPMVARVVWRLRAAPPHTPAHALLLQLHGAPRGQVCTSVAGSFYLDFGGLGYAQLSEVRSLVCDVDADLAAGGAHEVLASLQDAEAVDAATATHARLNDTTASDWRRVGALCALSTCDERGRARLSRCTGCRAAWYCSAEHQAADWARHKRDCRAAQAARRSGGAT